MATKTQYTTNDAAERFNRHQSRIRQVCQQFGIGRVIANRVRILSERDMEKLSKIFEKHGNSD